MRNPKTGQYRSRLKPWSLAVIDALAKRPMPIDELVAIGMSKVPPGRGFRRASRETNRVSVEQSVESGQRQLVRDSIRSMTVGGSIRKYELDGKVYCEITDEGKRRLTVERSR